MQAVAALGLSGLVLFCAHAGLGLWAAQQSAFEVLYVALYLFPAALCIGRAILVPSERRPWLLFGLGMVAMMVWRPRGLIAQREPSVVLKESKGISASLVKEGHG